MVKLGFVNMLAGFLVPVLAIDNGYGITPPMGWRSWNCYAGDISDSKMRAVVDAMVSKNRLVDGVPTSLLEVGYDHCGIDDG